MMALEAMQHEWLTQSKAQLDKEFHEEARKAARKEYMKAYKTASKVRLLCSSFEAQQRVRHEEPEAEFLPQPAATVTTVFSETFTTA